MLRTLQAKIASIEEILKHGCVFNSYELKLCHET